ncbi:MAG: cytochrome P450 [Acidimicrobiaceae bacterium]|nr:cytochrome P450 [Acidimicrobiaceae bacterium]
MSSETTFDLFSPELKGASYWDALREVQRQGPITWIESSRGGFWGVTSSDLVLRMAQDWANFTSTEGVTIPRPGPDVVPYICPIEMDPPRQRAYRKQVNPQLTAKVMEPYEASIRQIADELIDTFIEQGSCDIARDFARKFPGTVFLKLILCCPDEEFREVEPLARDISFEPANTERWARAVNGLREWAARTLASRTDNDDPSGVVKAVRHLNDSGEPFVDHEHASGLQILVQGGIGTSASVIGVIMRVLSEHPELQARVRNDLSLVPVLIEECLRLETPLPLEFRTAAHDVEIAGKQIKKGDKVGLFFGAANRDPEVFDHPDDVDLERPHFRHLSFGAGVHRCVGSNLARLQIRVAVEQLLTRLSPFSIPEGAVVQYSSLQARGPSSIPLAFSPRP